MNIRDIKQQSDHIWSFIMDQSQLLIDDKHFNVYIYTQAVGGYQLVADKQSKQILYYFRNNVWE